MILNIYSIKSNEYLLLVHATILSFSRFTFTSCVVTFALLILHVTVLRMFVTRSYKT